MVLYTILRGLCNIVQTYALSLHKVFLYDPEDALKVAISSVLIMTLWKAMLVLGDAKLLYFSIREPKSPNTL